MVIPQGFDEEFLTWFRIRTEAAWRHYRTRDFVQQRRAGIDWLPESRWLADLSKENVLRIEEHRNITFPSQYRVFLQNLHALDRPVARATFDGTGIKVEPSIGFYNWRTNEAEITQAMLSPIEGVLFDVQVNNLWIPAWGNRPGDTKEKIRVVRELAAHAPNLIPIIGHRYAVDAAETVDDYVLSVSQSDIILFATDLRSFLLNEFKTLLQLDFSRVSDAYRIGKLMSAEKLPFWGELIKRARIP